MSDYSALLKQYWGYETFRPLQREVIESVCGGFDTLVLMPTGGGKSLTYQLPAMAMEGICVVITPLIALMKDQRDDLRRRGILSIAVHSGMSGKQIDAALDNCIYGKYKFLYISPERIDSELFRARFSRMEVSLIAVDEAHCISQWGYDFRPSYLKIARLRKLSPRTPVLALTASATPAVVRDITDRLEFTDGRIFRMSFARKNLCYVVRRTENKSEQLLRILRNVPGCGIVYCRTRERTEKVDQFLKENGIESDYYHGGLGHRERNLRQDGWMRGNTRVMVATNAFGMGIDKPDVRFVVHADPCDNPEAYYQEAGRAGRDGKTAYAVMLVSGQDIASLRQRVNLDFPPVDEIRKVYEKLCNFLQVGIGAGKGNAFDFNLYEFCSANRLFTPMAVNALKILQLNGYLILTEENDHPARVMFTVSRDDLYRIQVNREELDYFIKVLLRTYTGIFSNFVAVNEKEIAYLSGYTLDKVYAFFKQLWQMRIIKYIPGKRTSLIVFPEERLEKENVRISPESYRIRKEAAEVRFRAISKYIENETECRSLLLQNYFGEGAEKGCGRCDICRERMRIAPDAEAAQDVAAVTLEQEILESIPSDGITLPRLVGQLPGDLSRILEAVSRLTAEGKFRQLPDGRIVRYASDGHKRKVNPSDNPGGG